MIKIIGVDEAGRGPWAGAVVAGACCFLQKNEIINKLRDSKKLSKITREKLAIELKNLEKGGVCVLGIGEINNDKIDEIGIKNANKLAMEKAIKEVIKKLKTKNTQAEKILIDGRDGYIFKGISYPVEYIIKGDDKIDEIKAASIIAKTFRDEKMNKLAKKYPQYGFEKHMGYGTSYHQSMLEKYGICPIHRKSYKPIKNILISKGFGI